jgi:predicted CopG family antitoxin
MRMKNVKKYFLGGTCGNSTWREDWIKLNNNQFNYFNPVVANWDEKAQKIEDKEKELCDVHVYTLTEEQKGAYSFFEIAYSLYKGKEVIIVVLGVENSTLYKSTVEKIIKDLSNNESVSIYYSLEEFFK